MKFAAHNVSKSRHHVKFAVHNVAESRDSMKFTAHGRTPKVVTRFSLQRTMLQKEETC